MPKSKENNSPGPKEISKAMQNSFERENKYLSIKFGNFRKMVESVPAEYDECEVSFAFILKATEGNFELGTVGIKLMAVHPDQTKVMLCDDAAAEQFFKIKPTITYTGEDGQTTIEGE